MQDNFLLTLNSSYCKIWNKIYDKYHIDIGSWLAGIMLLLAGIMLLLMISFYVAWNPTSSVFAFITSFFGWLRLPTLGGKILTIIIFVFMLTSIFVPYVWRVTLKEIGPKCTDYWGMRFSYNHDINGDPMFEWCDFRSNPTNSVIVGRVLFTFFPLCAAVFISYPIWFTFYLESPSESRNSLFVLINGVTCYFAISWWINLFRWRPAGSIKRRHRDILLRETRIELPEREVKVREQEDAERAEIADRMHKE